MNLFKRYRGNPEVSEEALTARAESEQSQASAIESLARARILAAQLAQIRQRNHFAEAIRASMKGTL